ncbi:MAG: hypothetical protein U1F68_17580 [Gammaproteobacteria bacterium]
MPTRPIERRYSLLGTDRQSVRDMDQPSPPAITIKFFLDPARWPVRATLIGLDPDYYLRAVSKRRSRRMAALSIRWRSPNICAVSAIRRRSSASWHYRAGAASIDLDHDHADGARRYAVRCWCARVSTGSMMEKRWMCSRPGARERALEVTGHAIE